MNPRILYPVAAAAARIQRQAMATIFILGPENLKLRKGLMEDVCWKRGILRWK